MKPNSISETVPIVFTGGCYGTYLQWVLTTITSSCNISPPFNRNGNSHKFNGTHLVNMAGWKEYVQSADPTQFVRLHPKVTKDQSIIENISIILKTVKKILYIYPDTPVILLTINNSFNKIWNSWWEHQFSTSIDPAVIYKNWPVSSNTPIELIPFWVQREFLSLYLMPAWTSLANPFVDSNDSVLLINVSDLLYNFESTMKNIQNFLDIPFTKSVDEMVPLHQQMLELQQYTNHDVLCNQIVNTTLSEVLFDWSGQPLSLASESWIQWRLRELGYEMACHGLDILPTNSVQLKELLYKP